MIFHSAFENSYLWLPLFAFAIGLIGSLIGGGGGFFFLPVLILVYNIPAQISVATSLAATLPICFIGSIGHYRHGNMDLHTGLLYSGAGIAGALSGASLTSMMTPGQLKVSFGIYSVLLSIYMVISHWKEKRARADGEGLPGNSGFRKFAKGSFFGFLAGVITATFGTSGAAPVQAGLFAMHLPIKLVVGTSLFVVLFNTFSALGAHFLVGEIDLTLVVLLASGAALGALSGPKLLSSVNIDHAEGPVRFWYAMAMAAFGIAMIITR